MTEKVIKKEEYTYIKNEILEELDYRIDHFNDDWAEIKRLSNLEENTFISESSKGYFRRPFSSTYLFPEDLGLNNFTSTYPLPAAFSEYETNLHIEVHNSVTDGIDLLSETDMVIDKKVGFFYV